MGGVHQGHCDALFQRGGVAAAGDGADDGIAGGYGVAGAGGAAAGHFQSDEAAGGAVGALVIQHVGAVESAVAADKAAQAGLNGGNVGGEFVAVQGQAGLQAQHIAGAEAAGQGAGGGQGVPDGGGVGGAESQLKAVLAGVAGAPDKDAAAVNMAASPGERPQG